MSYLSAPVEDLIPVTLSDTEDIPAGSRALFLPVSGTVSCIMKNGQVRTVALTSGWHPMQVLRVRVTGTTSGLTVYAGY